MTRINNLDDIIEQVKADKWMMDVLKAAKSLDLPDWWVCAGFVRAKIWDVLHGFQQRTPLPDVDVIYFNDSMIEEAQEKTYEQQLKSIIPDIPWSVKNQARMHVLNNNPPYTSSIDAMSKFPETATALGLKLNRDNDIILAAPCGLNDVINLKVKPTPYFQETKERAQIYEQRLIQKHWQANWDKIKVTKI
ncbi:nucleotidyltransferase family protein [Tuberibacillus sp. Marseille-P3662]|uniref:nucleotidyltransferase family protein n=1 Tax=Tuberibacillus sp. Marseille-P3662 TaxID=1965358 RepID=UPI000A1CAC86|nr:nucleotidyltransferase family protein [Tuberibacillus sp. Marseille-P3662]